MRKPLSILVVHEVDFLQKVVFEFQEFPEVWARRGHSVTVVDFAEVPSRATQKTFDQVGVRRALTDGPGIRLIRPKLTFKGVASRLFAFFQYRALFERLFATSHFDLVFLYSAPTNGLSLLAVARQYGVPVIFRSIDILHHMRQVWTRPVVFWAERKVYRNSTWVSALTPALQRYSVRMGCKPHCVSLQMPAVSSSIFSPGDPHKPNLTLREKWGLRSDSKIVLYIGTFFPFSGLDILTESLREICGERPDLHFLFVGGGALRNFLKSRAEQFPSHLTVLDFRPFLEMPEFIRESSLCLNPFLPGPITNDIVPSKIFQYLACGVPTLSTPLKGTREILPEERSGVIYAPIEGFPRRILQFFAPDHEIERQRMRENALTFIGENHSQEVQVESFEKLFYDLIEGKKA